VEEQRMFNNATFSTGELSIVSDNSNRGEKIRAWDIFGQPFGSKNLQYEIDEIESILKDNYGLAFEIFLQEFFRKQESYKQKYKIMDHNLSSEEARVMKIVEKIYVTGMIINNLFDLKWDVKTDVKVVFDIIAEKLEKDSGENSSGSEIMSSIKSKFDVYETDFIFLEKNGLGNWRYDNCSILDWSEGGNKTYNSVRNSIHNFRGYLIKEIDGSLNLAWIMADFEKVFTEESPSKIKNILLEEKIIEEKRKRITIKGQTSPYFYIPNWNAEEKKEEEVLEKKEENCKKSELDDPF